MSVGHQHIFRADLLSALQDRTVFAPFPTQVRAWELIFLQSGELLILDNGTATHLAALGLVCFPSAPDRQVRLLAGSSGIQLGLSETSMVAALGSRPEALELQQMIRTLVSVSLREDSEQAMQIGQAIQSITWELEHPSPGQLTMIEAQIRCLLVHLWRHGARDPLGADAAGAAGAQEVLLRRFRQLVETQFRSRWRVGDYARALGVSTDRLHAIATRALGRTPIALVHDRTIREARALLTRSGMTLDQLASHLGFASSAQFSAFFKKHDGLPPGQYRARARLGAHKGTGADEGSFTDWP